MQVSAILPFRGDPTILLWTLEGFLQQQLSPGTQLTIYLGGDGCPLPPLPASPNPQIHLDARQLPRVGNSVAKNLLLAAGGQDADILYLANADTRPDPQCIQRHIDRLLSLPPGSLVLGAAPYDAPPPGQTPTVFDLLKSDTPMIFFYCQMAPGQWYDYRYTWTLNLSLRMSDLAAASRAGEAFSSQLFPYGYEDLDLGFRIMGATRKGIYYDDQAIVRHRHPMDLDYYLNREEMLGLMMPVVYHINRPMFTALMGGGSDDLATFTANFRTWVEMDRPSHRWIYTRLQEWVTQPATILGNDRQRLLDTLYQMHIPLKRLAFRLGFLRGLDLVSDSRKHERTPTGLWRQAIT